MCLRAAAAGARRCCEKRGRTLHLWERLDPTAVRFSQASCKGSTAAVGMQDRADPAQLTRQRCPRHHQQPAGRISVLMQATYLAGCQCRFLDAAGRLRRQHRLLHSFAMSGCETAAFDHHHPASLEDPCDSDRSCQRCIADCAVKTVDDGLRAWPLPAGSTLPGMQSLLRGLGARSAAGASAGALGTNAVQRHITTTHFRGAASVRSLPGHLTDQAGLRSLTAPSSLKYHRPAFSCRIIRSMGPSTVLHNLDACLI